MCAAFPFGGDLEVGCGADTGHALNASSLGTIPSLNCLLRCRGPRYPKDCENVGGMREEKVASEMDLLSVHYLRS